MLVDKKITKIIGGGFEIAEVKYMDKTVWRQYIPPRIYNITDSTVARKIIVPKGDYIDAGNGYEIKLSINDKTEVVWISVPLEYNGGATQNGLMPDEVKRELSILHVDDGYSDYEGFFTAFKHFFLNRTIYVRWEQTVWGEYLDYHNSFPFIKNGKDSMAKVIVMQKSTPEKEQEVLKNLKL